MFMHFLRRLRVAALALALAPSIARASITPEAQAIVDHYLEATGGAAASAGEHATHSVWRLHALELSGRGDTWTQAPDRFATTITLGPLKFREGFDGTVGWVTDLNARHVRLLDGKELEDARGEAYFDNEMWARPDQGGGSVAPGARSFREDGQWVSIEVKPPVGRGKRLWFSARTGMMMRVESHLDHGSSDVFLSDYKPIQGRKRATVQGCDPTMLAAFEAYEYHPDRFTLDAIEVNPSLDSTTFAAPRIREGTIAWRKTRGVARVPFRYGGRHVWIKASINGAPPMDFLLDTGCSASALDRDYAAQIGLIQESKGTTQGIAGSGSETYAHIASIRLVGAGNDGVTLRDFTVGVVDLGKHHEIALWRKMGGLIGYDFLNRFVVEIDYDLQVVTFRDPATYVHAGPSPAIAMKLKYGIPMIPVRLNDRCGGDFILDVGSDMGCIVHGSLVRTCPTFHDGVRRKELEVYGGGIGGGFVSWLTRLDSLSLGSFRLREPIAGLSLSTQGMVGSEDVAGNIGNGVLEHFRCTFDYPHARIYLDPGERFAERDRYSRVGAYLFHFQDRVLAADIVHGSPADEAGLKLADEVVLIDGRPAIDYTLEQLDRLLTDGEVGSVHTFTIRREGKRSTLTLTLADVI